MVYQTKSVNYYETFPLPYHVFLAAHFAVVQPGLLLDIMLVEPGFLQVHNDTRWLGVVNLAYLSQVTRSRSWQARAFHQQLPVVHFSVTEPVLQKQFAERPTAE